MMMMMEREGEKVVRGYSLSLKQIEKVSSYDNYVEREIFITISIIDYFLSLSLSLH
jgi:hypothetical protein